MACAAERRSAVRRRTRAGYGPPCLLRAGPRTRRTLGCARVDLGCRPAGRYAAAAVAPLPARAAGPRPRRVARSAAHRAPRLLAPPYGGHGPAAAGHLPVRTRTAAGALPAEFPALW